MHKYKNRSCGTIGNETITHQRSNNEQLYIYTIVNDGQNPYHKASVKGQNINEVKLYMKDKKSTLSIKKRETNNYEHKKH